MTNLEQLLFDSAEQAQESNRLITELMSKTKNESVLVDPENNVSAPSIARRIHLYLSSLVASGALDGDDAVGLTSASIDGTGHLIMSLTTGIDLDLGRVEGIDGDSIQNAEIVSQELVITLTDGTVFNLGKVEGTDGISVTDAFIEGSDLKIDLSDGSTINAGDVSQFGGISAQSADITESGDLVIVYSNGDVQNIGPVVGDKGDNGRSVVTTYVNKIGELEVLMSDGAEVNAGKVSKTVIDGTTKSVSSASIDGNGHLIITLSDASTIDTGRVLGTDGIDGRNLDAVSIDEAGELVMDYSDGSTEMPGVVQKTVIDGSNISIADAVIDNDGKLALTVWDGSDLTTYDLGKVVGTDGVDGTGVTGAHFDGDTLVLDMSDGSTSAVGDVDRTVLTDVAVNGNGELELTYTRADTTTYVENVGVVVGSDGVDGVGVSTASVDGNGDLIFTLTDANTVNVGKVTAENLVDISLSGQDMVVTLSDGSTKTFTGVVGTDGTDGTYLQSGSIDANGDLIITLSDTSTLNAGKLSTMVDNAVVDGSGNLIITLSDGTQFNTGKVTATDGTDGLGVKDITLQGETLVVETDDGQFTYVTDIVGEDGTDGTGISDIAVVGRDVEITLTDSTKVTVPTVIGEDGTGIDTVVRDGDDLVFTMTDGAEYRFSDLAGIDGNTITSVNVSGTDIEFNLSDGTTETITAVRGIDGNGIASIAYDGNDLTITLDDSTTETIPSVHGVDGVGIDTMTATESDVTTTLTDGSTVFVPFTAATDGEDGTSVTDASIDGSDHLIFTLSDASTIDAGKLGSGIQNAVVNGSGELELTLTDGSVITSGVVKAVDGLSVTDATLTGDTLTIDLSDGSTITAGDVSRVEVTSVSLDTGDLLIDLSDGSTINAGRVNGLDGRFVTGATVDVNKDLILSMNRDGDINAGSVQGDPGLTVKEAEVKLNGDLIITLNDDSLINAGNVGSGAGLTVHETGKTYEKDRVVVLNGSMYIALAETSTTPPSDDWRAFAFGDEVAEIRTPTLDGPTGTAENLYPLLDASEYAPIVSDDPRDYREFQVDVDTGDFSAPVYSASVNEDDHEVSSALTSGQAYIWRCRDVGLYTGYTTPWSETGSFTAPTESIAKPSVALDASENVNAATGATLVVGDAFAMAAGSDTHTSTDWEVTLASDGSLVVNSLGDTENLTEWSVPFGSLSPATDYKVKVRYNTATYTSPWSDEAAFTTEGTFDYVQAPNVFYDGNEANASVTPEFLTAPMEVNGGHTDALAKTDWELRKTSDGSPVFSSMDDAVNLQSITVTPELTIDTDYQMRARYHGERFGVSDWSAWVGITVAPFIEKPVVSTPGDVNDLLPFEELTASEFVGVNDTHVSTDWKIVRDITEEVVWESLADTSNLTTINAAIPNEYLDTDVRIRVRFNGNVVSSAWSDDLTAHVAALGTSDVFAGDAVGNVYHYDATGVPIWTNSDLTDEIGGLVYENGYLYAGDATGDIVKIDDTGTTLWNVNYGHRVGGIGILSTGEVIAAVRDQGVLKLDPADGSTLATNGSDHTGNFGDLAIGQGDSIFFTTAYNSTTPRLYKYDSGLNKLWSVDFGGRVMKLALDSQGNSYAGGYDNTVRKINGQGSEVWNVTVPNSSMGFAVNETEGLVFVMTIGNEMYAFDIETGSTVWSIAHSWTDDTDGYGQITVSAYGYLYAGDSNGDLYKYDPVDGSTVWTVDTGINKINTSAVTPGRRLLQLGSI